MSLCWAWYSVWPGPCIQGYPIYSSFFTPVQLHSPNCPRRTGLRHGFSVGRRGDSNLWALWTPCHDTAKSPSCCCDRGMLPAVCVPLEQGRRAVFQSPPVSIQIPLLRHLQTEVLSYGKAKYQVNIRSVSSLKNNLVFFPYYGWLPYFSQFPV